MPRTFEGNLVSPKGRFAITVSRFNGFITEPLLQGAIDALVRHGVDPDKIDVYRCPGTWELVGLTRKVALAGKHAAVVALGCVIRGGTPHFDYVAGEAAKGLGALAATSDVPVGFGVLTCDTVEQAVDRAGVKAGNKGAEAALACVEMVNLYAAMGK